MKINDIKIEQGYNLLCTKLQNKSDEDTSAFGLLKLPIEVLYSEALKEIGAQESYIDELSYTINNLKTENMVLNQKLELFEFINEEERLNIESDKNYLNKAASRNKLNKENKSLREDISTLICKLVACQKEISLLKQQLSAYQQAG